MTVSQTAPTPLPGGLAHPSPVRPPLESGNVQDGPSSGVECGMCHEVRTPATWCMDSEIGEYAVCGPCNTPRRMVAVTVALSEPMSSEPLDWPATIASLLRLTYANTTVEVIDTWRNDE